MKRIAGLVCALMLMQTAFALEETEWIKIAEGFVAPEEPTTAIPAVMTRGETEIDAHALLEALLGADYIEQEEGRFAEAKDGEVWEIRQVSIDAQTGEFRYYDPMVSSERGAEYEPPAIGIGREQALEECRALLGGILPEEYIAHASGAFTAQDRWHAEDRRWMDDAEYEEFCRQRQLAHFRFDHLANSGLAILGDGLMASIGANGLNGFTLNRHAFEASEQTAQLMPLQDALKMANSTRGAETVLLYAQPVYSNWLSGDENYNLSWYLVTSRGNYVVDCVLGRHMCDSWEY